MLLKHKYDEYHQHVELQLYWLWKNLQCAIYATFSREVGAFTLTEAAVNKHVSSEKGKY